MKNTGMIFVDDDPVSEEAVRLEYNRLCAFHAEHQPRDDLESMAPELWRRAREQAIGSVLLMREARRRNIAVAPERVEEKFRDMINSCGGKEAFMRMVSRKSLDLEALRVAVAGGLQVDELVRMITADVPDPAESEIQEYYDHHHAAFVTPEKVRVRHILLKFDASQPAERAAAVKKLKGFASDIGEGADFAGLAKLHSECPSGREAGGLIGWIGRGAVLPAMEQAVFELTENGVISEPVETPLGMHLFQRLGHRPSRQASYAEARDRVFELMRHARRGKRLDEFVAELKKNAVIRETDDNAALDAGDADLGFDINMHES